MKKLYIAIALLACIAFSACNDEWKDELYEQMISFKAPVDATGISNIYLRYNPDGVCSYQLPVIVSGTTDNANNLEVKIGVDNDTLDVLNIAKFLHRTDLYYRQLPETFYSLASETCHIPAGSNVQSYTIDFNFTNLDLVEKWVLPLTIEPGEGYTPNMWKGWRKALLKINLFNDYSGKYSATSMNIYMDGETTDPATISERNVSVVDENSVFFYAGTVWEEDVNRSKYKVIVTFNPGTTDESGTVSGTLTLRPGDAANEMNLQSSGTCTYEIRSNMDPVQPYLKHYYVTMQMQYNYTDLTSDPSNPIVFNARGSLVLERKINTLIPDQDQAIQW